MVSTVITLAMVTTVAMVTKVAVVATIAITWLQYLKWRHLHSLTLENKISFNQMKIENLCLPITVFSLPL